MNTAIYLDWNATAPVWPEVVAEMADTVRHAWANPSSMHAPGQAARRVLVDARARVASFLGASPPELVFTSGATESNHAAVRGVLAAARGTRRQRLVVSGIEHPGLLALADQLQAEGTPVDRIPVAPDGQLDLDAAARLIDEEVALVSVMGANNETGVCQPIGALAARVHAAGALLHSDATQCLGKLPLNLGVSGADLVSLSAHKIGGPRGVGALWVRKGVALQPLIAGRQERHRRGGTENLPGIAGFPAACERTARTMAEDPARMGLLRDRLEQGLLAALPGTRVVGAGAPRLPNTCCLRFGALDADPVLTRLERAGVIASSGAACSAGGTQPSHVLLALGLDAAAARGGVRFSLGPTTTAVDIKRALDAAVRALSPLLAADAAAAPA